MISLTEALAGALERAGYGEVSGDLDQYQEWGGSPRRIAIDILSDPAFRTALNEALAEAEYAAILPEKHGQLCPVWTRHRDPQPPTRRDCDCWQEPRSVRHAAAIVSLLDPQP